MNRVLFYALCREYIMAQKEIKLVDVEKPNLYRDIFPYSEFPQVTFDDQDVPYDIPD